MDTLSTPVASVSGPRSLTDTVTEVRAINPGHISRALAQRLRVDLARTGRLMVIACDRPARGALGAGERPLVMIDHEDLLRRRTTALSRPDVSGLLRTAEIIKGLTLLSTLGGKFVRGSMNRIGLQGASLEMDDHLGVYDADGIEASHLDSGKMLTHVNDAGPASIAALGASAKAIDSLSECDLNTMIEPFISRWENGRIVNDFSEGTVIRSTCIAQTLRRSSVRTWLKLPRVSDPAPIRHVMTSTSPPSLILGGKVSTDPEATHASWAAAPELPSIRGLVVDRSLLYPGNSNVKAAVDAAVVLL